MDDHVTADALERSLSFVGFPEHDGEGRSIRYLAGNPLGDALVVYARSFGPLLARVNKQRTAKSWRST